MRVLMVSHELRHNGSVYGLLEYGGHLAANGHTVVLSVPETGHSLRDAFAAAGIAVAGMTVDPGAHDIVIVNTLFGYRAVAALAPHMPVIWWIHETLQGARLDITPEAVQALFTQTTKLVFASTWLLGLFSDLLGPLPLFAADIVPLGFHAAEPPPELPSNEAERDGFRILFVGSLYPRKRPGDLVRAIESLGDPSISCIFVGERFGTPSPAIAFADRHPERYRFVIVPDRSLAAFYDECDMFALPSAGETFGRAAVEAGRAGLPVVLSDLPAYAPLWRHEDNALLHPVADVAALAACIERLRHSPELRRRLGGKARNVARQFPIEAMFHRLDATLTDAWARWHVMRPAAS